MSRAGRNLSHWINCVNYGRDLVVVTLRGRPKAVNLGVEALEEWVGLHEVADGELMPMEQFRTEFRQAPAKSGCQRRDEITDPSTIGSQFPGNSTAAGAVPPAARFRET